MNFIFCFSNKGMVVSERTKMHDTVSMLSIWRKGLCQAYEAKRRLPSGPKQLNLGNSRNSNTCIGQLARKQNIIKKSKSLQISKILVCLLCSLTWHSMTQLNAVKITSVFKTEYYFSLPERICGHLVNNN